MLKIFDCPLFTTNWAIDLASCAARAASVILARSSSICCIACCFKVCISQCGFIISHYPNQVHNVNKVSKIVLKLMVILVPVVFERVGVGSLVTGVDY